MNKLLIMGDLHKAAGLIKARVADLEQQIADASRRLDKLESREHWPAFYEAGTQAPVSATWHRAPARMQ
jgi:hypothetical protein